MDNLTHTIVGLGAGELVHRSLAPEATETRQRTRHRLLLTACALASNFPDLDLLISGGLPNPLSYLLEHRGYTHTVLYALPEAVLLVALLWLCWPAARALLRESRPARIGLAATVAIGFALHLLMDYTNSYGIHPFYPFDTRWFYGDMVFIVEPWYWVVFGVPLIMTMPRRTARATALLLFGAVLLFFALRGYLGTLPLCVMIASGAGLAAMQHRDGTRGRSALVLALLLSVGLVALQSAASDAGRARITGVLQRDDPPARVLDVAMTAFPSQPLCWNFASLEVNEAADSYRLRRGVISLAPQWLAPLACPRGLVEQGASAALTPAIAVFGQASASLHTLRALKDANCYVDAWLRFARMPQLQADELSDYRFSATPRGNFSTLPFAALARDACPQSVPAWSYPRADMLTPPASVPRR